MPIKRPQTAIFVSHEHLEADFAVAIAEAVAGMIGCRLDEVRCTSSSSMALRPGEEIREQLRADLAECRLVIALVGSSVKRSGWVMAELGAAWMAGKPILPILLPGTAESDVPILIQNLNLCRLEDERSIVLALKVVAHHCGQECADRRVTLRAKELGRKVRAIIGGRRSARAPDPTTMSSDVVFRFISRGGQIRNSLPPEFERVFGNEIDNMVDVLKAATDDLTIEISSLERFRHYYQEMLSNVRSESYFATSLPYRRYFWLPTSGDSLRTVEGEMRAYIQQGGVFRRLFFLASGDEESGEVQEVLARQLDIGIKVFTVERAAVPSDLYRFFVVNHPRTIAWTVSVDESQRISSIEFTAAPSRLRGFEMKCQRLMALPEVRSWPRKG